MNERPAARAHDWLELIEVSGPFLALPVLKDAFPQGLEGLDGVRAQRLRRAYEEWRDAVDADDPQLVELHRAWIDEVLATALEMDADVIRRGDAIPEGARAALPEHGVVLVPDLILVDSASNDKPLLLVHVFDPDADLDVTRNFGSLAATVGERMATHLRAIGCPLGLISNGERWMLVHAPVGGVATFASWYARLWGQEPDTLRALVSLLGVRRFFGPDENKLSALLERSLEYQDEVTVALGEQVRRAIEVLVQALDRADEDRNRELLHDVEPHELYEAGLTVMMRLVFMLSAEERGLLLLGDSRYDLYYAVSTLRTRLRRETEEILERRRSAWSRLLALFRAVYGGIEHPALRLPAFGGSLFDPDRLPFLEGRLKGTSWRTHPAEPLPIDDRTVLLLLEAIQTFEGRTLSYRALDVEQIGHVYEGLLERTVERVKGVTLELDSATKAKSPRVSLDEVESARMDGRDRLLELLKERSGRSESAIRNDLDRQPDDRIAARLLTVCRGDVALRDRILPYAELLRTDPWGYPLVHHAGAFVVVLGSHRRETGTHYTPKSLTEKIVEETLIPIVYEGPAEGKAREEWKRRSSDELLDLKICDPAMGSGAFLVQVCRWLADRVVEAWNYEESQGETTYVEDSSSDAGRSTSETIPRDPEERALLARRLIAERCLYGVDLNRLAVELAKLSLWLTTLAKGRPFGFLDHNLKSGDSLLGICRLDQLTELALEPKEARQNRLFGQNVRHAVAKALELRQRLRQTPIRDIRDVEVMATLDAQARAELDVPESLADAFIGSIFAFEGRGALETRLDTLAIEADRVVQGDGDARHALLRQTRIDFAKGAPDGRPRRAFHWPLEFPEVFQREKRGFDAIVSNPPFLGGQRITGVAGTAYRDWLVGVIAEGRRGSADLVAYFFLRAYSLLGVNGSFGLLAVNTIAEGDTRQVGLEALVRSGAIIYAAYPNEPWPGAAAVVTSRVHVHKGDWHGSCSLLGRPVPYISPFLSDHEEWSAKRLKANEGLAFQGSIVLGMGFVLTQDEAQRMLDADPRNAEVVFPYLNGEDLNSDPEQRPTRWVINFWDWPEDRARTYELPYRRVKERVKLEREKNKRKERRERWWQFAERTPALFHAIGRGHYFERHPDGWDPNMKPLEQVVACSLVAKYLMLSFVHNDTIFAHKLAIIASNAQGLWACLSSSIHDAWAKKNSSTLGFGINYSPSDAFETFPLPDLDSPRVSSLGEAYARRRSTFMQTERKGLTKLYNSFHDPSEKDPRVRELREIHREIDSAVARAYGWGDIDLGHGFHLVSYLPENDRVRFTIADDARLEVLRRLSDRNRQRYEKEVANGLHGGSVTKRTVRTRREPEESLQRSLDLSSTSVLAIRGNQVVRTNKASFARAAEPTAAYEVKYSQAILEYLKSNPGWHSRNQILGAVGIADRNWSALISDLTKRGLVERQRERRSTQYRAKVK